MSSRTSLSIAEEYGLTQRPPIALRFFLLATLTVFCAALSPAQVESSQFVDRQLAPQQHVSINQLLTPEKAKKATEKAREDLAHGRFDSALREAERALDIFPRCATALSIEGAVNLLRTNYAEAGREFQRAIDADPALGSAYLGLGMALTSEGRFKDALVPLDRAATFLPTSWTVHFEAALARLGVGESEAALKEITYAERFAPSDPKKQSGVALLRGVALLQMNDRSGAKANLAETIERDSNGIYAALARERLAQFDDGQTAHSTVPSPF